jgi:T5SS/PEP-CTERM-associated repeat protein
MSQIIINSDTTVTAGQTLSAVGFTLTDGTPAIVIASGTGTFGNLLVTGAGALLDTAGYPIAIGNSGSGTLTLAAGAVLQTGSLGGAPSVKIGNKVGSSGTVVVTGAGSTLNSADQMDVGNAGSGVLLVSAGGTVNAGAVGTAIALIVASNSGSSGIVDVTGSGSLLHATDQVNVGKSAAGSMTIEAGGTFLIDNTNTAHLAVSIAGSGTADGSQLVVTGAGSMLLANGSGTPATVVVGGHGSGTLDITDGATLTASVVDSGHADGAAAGTPDGTGLILVDGTGSRINAGYALVDGGSVINGASLASTVSVTNGGSISAGRGILWAGSILATDTASAVEFGGAGGAAAGSIQIDAGSSLSGSGTVSAGSIVNAGTLAAAGGLLLLDGTVTGPGILQIGAGATLEAASTATGSAIFAGAGTLRIDLPLGFSGTIASASVGATIDLVGALGSDPVFVTQGGGQALQIVTDIGTVDIAVSTSVAMQGLGSMSDGAGGTLVTIACFAAGTMILTDRGRVAVERLREGDRVVSAFGGVVPISWIGHRHIDCRRHPEPLDVMPVRIRRDAFAPGVPDRDLFLSPDHAVHVSDHAGPCEGLVPVRHLINGTTITQEPIAQVTYCHVELPVHDVIFANALSCESYLDTGNRGAFQNGGGVVAAHADFARGAWETSACAPLIEGGTGLDAIRSGLATRARDLGFAPGTGVECRIGTPGTYRSIVPALETTIRLLSDPQRPPGDRRWLGVAVSRITLDGAPIALDAQELSAGFYARETDGQASWRWTTGDAVLVLPPRPVPRVLEVTVAFTAARSEAA